MDTSAPAETRRLAHATQSSLGWALVGAVVLVVSWLVLRFVADFMGPDPFTFYPEPSMAIWLGVGILACWILSRSRVAALTAAVLGLAGVVLGMALASTFLGVDVPRGEAPLTALVIELRRAIGLAYVEPATMILNGVFVALTIMHWRRVP